MSQFLAELEEAPERLRATLDQCLADDARSLSQVKRLMQDRKLARVVFTGMGSSHMASLAVAGYLNQHNVPTYVIEAGELAHYQAGVITPDTLLVVVSRSGESKEIREVIERTSGWAMTLGITDEPDSFLASNCNMLLMTRAGEEKAPTTKSYICTVGLLLSFALSLAGELTAKRIQSLYRIADLSRELLAEGRPVVEKAASFLSEVAYVNLLGRGPSMATVLQGALILKELPKVTAEGMSSASFEHGPDLLVNEQYRAIVFSPQGRTAGLDRDLIRTITDRGGRVVAIANWATGLTNNDVYCIEQPLTAELLAPVLQFIPVALLADVLACQ